MIDLKLARGVYLCALLSAVFGLEITSTGPTSIEKASGESVKLDCQFTLAPEDSGPLDIEWSLQPSDNQKEEKVVILYSGDRAYEHYYPPLKGRVHFSSADPKMGDASINLLRVEAGDTGTYQCKVKKAPGIRSRKVLLTVMVRPSKPRCYIEGSAQVGSEVMLKCKSTDGTSPLQYIWEKTSGTKLLPGNAVLGTRTHTLIYTYTHCALHNVWDKHLDLSPPCFYTPPPSFRHQDIWDILLHRCSGLLECVPLFH
ncbi:coxsackievirus and adenovirus receptor homolog [Salminus brasiliensis]|uniref:coxsackievirus and adenovirus receptor homolog n=1 Tax=Salminus brasiliensis TaxID=930266 RepID=UPI003B83650C